MTATSKASSRGKSGVDVLIGERLRKARLDAGLTQEDLGGRVEVSYQQIQKYETGANRISASRLLMVSEALEIDVASFFAGLRSGDKAA